MRTKKEYSYFLNYVGNLNFQSICRIEEGGKGGLCPEVDNEEKEEY